MKGSHLRKLSKGLFPGSVNTWGVVSQEWSTGALSEAELTKEINNVSWKYNIAIQLQMVACRDLVLGGKSKELEPFRLQRKLRESLITACMVYTKTIIHLSISESGDICLHFGE